MERQVHHVLELLPDVMGRYDVDGDWSVRAFHRYSCTNSLAERFRSAARALIWSLMASKIHSVPATNKYGDLAATTPPCRRSGAPLDHLVGLGTSGGAYR
jgi:hypothetical protein